MSDEQQQVSNQISIEDLQLSLEVYQIQSDQKLQKLQELFNQKKTIDLRQVFYQERSSLQVKFQNIIGDLTEFLINQQVPSTQKLRKTFYRILQSPLLLLFKVSRFEIFNLRLNAFDIQLQPIDAVSELAKQLYKNIDNYVALQKQNKVEYNGSIYDSYDQFLEHSRINLIQDQVFILYSYLRKGSGILKKKVQDKIKIVQIFSNIEEKIINTLLKNQDVKTLKQLSILNYEIYLLQSGFDVLCYYLRIPFRNIYKDVFKELEILAQKAKVTCNYDIFINIFVKYNQEIIAKITNEKIDQSYVEYIQNLALTLLQLWGCRICQFRQFFSFFKILFQVHLDRKKILQICLKHTPNLSKEDISLIRANYRQNVQNKNVELVSLLKKASLDDINVELNSIYHQILYNLDFEGEQKQKIIELLTLINGNSNIQGFLTTAEKAFRQWNHTIDFSNSLKYIESEFSVPKNLNQNQILQSLRIFTNMCILQNKGFNKQFQQLVAKGAIIKAMTGLCKFLLSSQSQILKLFKQNKICEVFVVWGLKFLQNTLSKNSNEWEQLLYLFSNSISSISTKQFQQQIKTQVYNHIEINLQNYRLGKCMRILKKVYQFDRDQNNLKFIIDLFMKQTTQKQKQNRNYRFFGKKINFIQNQIITKEEADFLKQYSCVKDQTIEVKQTSCFKITELEVITNPVQFQKAMDNYFFTLDSNSKRFVQYVVQEMITQQSSTNNFYSELIEVLIQRYHVVIPILCNIRIKPNQNAKQNIQYRFAEFLVNQLLSNQSSSVKRILSKMINTQTIKYRNGKDYVVQQVIPMITKRVLTLINSGSLKNQGNNVLTIQTYEILACCLQRFTLKDLKVDTIQKSLLKINYQIQSIKCQKAISRLSQCFDKIIRVFFRKKQIDIKKKGLQQAYQKIVWSQIRTYAKSNNGSQPINIKPFQNVTINQQIMVSPYTLSQQYSNQEYKIKKPEQNKANKLSQQKNTNNLIKISDILPNLVQQNSQTQLLKASSANLSNKSKQIDISSMKCDIEFHLGKESILFLENKENWTIKQKQQSESPVNQNDSNQKSITFVQYYLRQMSHPQIGQQMVIKSILSYLKKQISISLIWSNPRNLQKLFVPLIILFDFACSNKNQFAFEKLKSEPQCWAQIVQYLTKNRIEGIKQILNLLSDLGYNNLWGQNYKSIGSYANIQKALQTKSIQEQSFLSVLLKKGLQFQFLNQIKNELDVLFHKIFSTRPIEQTSLMYKVGIDKNLLNLIMKSLQIKNLSNISFLFHSNFNNLRLYTDQLHEGLKALNIASKTRSYNQYIQLSKQTQDQQFLGPMKLFQQNFRFFIKIQKQGFNFKKMEEKKLCLERLINVLRQYSPEQKQSICKQCDKLIEQYEEQIQKLEQSIANRVKSFYLVTKLRDLTYQNAISINLINEILKEKKKDSEQILNQISKVQIFSLLVTLHRQLIRFDNEWDNQFYYQKYNRIDQSLIQKQVSFCTTRRFSHSMNKIYQKCDLQLDQVIQRSLDQLKLFFSTAQGKLYLERNKEIVYPAFLVKSFVFPQSNQRTELNNKISTALQKSNQNLIQATLTLKKGQFITELISQLRKLNTKLFYRKLFILVSYQGQSFSLDKFLPTIVKHMISNETLVWTKTKDSQFLTFNKYKTSQATLQEIELLGYLVAYCIFHQIPLVNGQSQILPLHNSIIAAFLFNIIDIQDLLHVDFKVWEDVKRILSLQDSKTQNLNFSYIFENSKTLENERVQLVDKGASKKVNNLNRDQFCDAIACHVLYKNLSSQLSRFIQAILMIIPKQWLSCKKISQIYPLFYNKQNIEKIIKRYQRKVGIVTPQIVFRDGKKIQNLKDYQNIQWATELILDNQQLREKYWKNQTNLLIVTTIGSKGNLSYKDHLLVIQHFESKQSMSLSFKQLTSK